MLLDQLTPYRHRHVITVFAVPWHLLHREATGARHENGSAEQELQGDRALAQRIQILCGCDLEVVGALQRQVDLGGAAESGHHRGAVLPQEGALCRAPAFARAEQVQEPGGFVVGVAAA